MKTALKIITISIFLVAILFTHVSYAVDDWAYELDSQAKRIYVARTIQVPCSRIKKLLQDNDTNNIYIAIRDAALFNKRSCNKHIKNNLSKLNTIDGVKEAISFFYLKMGNKDRLKFLIETFDKPNRSGDHWVVEIFGYMKDWNYTGKRLVRQTKNADGAAGELLCSSLKWKRYLFGEKNFKKNWFKYGKIESVNKESLDWFYMNCKP